MDACVLSVNVGPVREVEWRGKVVRTGIWKASVGLQAVALHGVNLDGDDQADRTVHGGVDKAVYAYAAEDYLFWSTEEGIETHPGLFGENLTIQGLDLGTALVGERWHVGSALLEVTQPRLPCFKLGIRMADAQFPKRFQSAGR
ncbi:MAG: MOSC domain-containing protein, partial [Gemmatimonadaceae bacterium]